MAHKILMLIFAMSVITTLGFANGFARETPVFLDQGGGSPPGYVDERPEDASRVQKKVKTRRRP